MAEEKGKDKKEEKKEAAPAAAEEPAEGEGGKKKKPLFFKIAIFASLAILLIGIVVMVSWKVSTIQSDPYSSQERPEKKAEERKYVPILDNILLGSKEVTDFKLVITDRGEQHNVKCIIYLGYSQEYNQKGTEFFDELQKRIPQLREIVYKVLGSKTYEELEYRNLDRLKEELLSKINETLEHGSIADIMFMEYIVQ